MEYNIGFVIGDPSGDGHACTTEYHVVANHSVDEISEANREDLASEYREELEVLKKLLPKPAEASDIEYILYNWADEKNFMDYSGEDLPKVTIPKKEVGGAIKHLKARFPQADGKMISEIIKKYIV